MDVWRMLRAKSDAMRPGPPQPLNPLEKAYAKRALTRELLYGEAPGHQRFSKKDRGQMKRTLEQLDREIKKLEASDEYADLPTPDPHAPKRAAARTASKIFEDIEEAFKRQLSGRRLQWQPARPGSQGRSAEQTPHPYVHAGPRPPPIGA